MQGSLPQQMKIRYYENFSESEAWSNHEDEVTGEHVTHKTATGKLVASSISEKLRKS